MSLGVPVTFGLDQLERCAAPLNQFVNAVHQNPTKVVLIKVAMPDQLTLPAQLIIQERHVVILGGTHRVLSRVDLIRDVESPSDIVCVDVRQAFVYIMCIQKSVDVVVLGDAPNLLLSQAVQDLGYDCLLLHKLGPIGEVFSSFIFLISLDRFF